MQNIHLLELHNASRNCSRAPPRLCPEARAPLRSWRRQAQNWKRRCSAIATVAMTIGTAPRRHAIPGHQRRLAINLHNRTTEFPSTGGNQRPCRDAGVGAIAPGFAMLNTAKRASHIDPPTSSYAIMQRACPYRGENPDPARMLTENLKRGPELENSQGQARLFCDIHDRSAHPPKAEQKQTCRVLRIRAISGLMHRSKTTCAVTRFFRLPLSARALERAIDINRSCAGGVDRISCAHGGQLPRTEAASRFVDVDCPSLPGLMPRML